MPKKLISSERPSKILQNETKIVLEIFNFKDQNLNNFTRKKDRKHENVVFLEVLHKLKYKRLSDVREVINAQFNNKQSQIFPSVDLIRI